VISGKRKLRVACALPVLEDKNVAWLFGSFLGFPSSKLSAPHLGITLADQSARLQLQEKILLQCGAKELAALKTTSQYFFHTDLLERSAREQLQQYPWTSSYVPG
jgi:hypothetical protein